MEITNALIHKYAIDANSLGHLALDIAGLIPGLGEPADLTNALWYAFDGAYLHAGLSLFAMIPAVGDTIAKPIKAFIDSGQKLNNAMIQALKSAYPLFLQLMTKLLTHQAVGPLVAKITAAVEKFIINQEKSAVVSETAKTASLETAEDMNMRAHPGGGASTVELPSTEGLVEDLYEAQMKNIEIAQGKSRLATLAELANNLEDAGINKYANYVDNIINKIAAENTDIEKIIESSKYIHSFLKQNVANSFMWANSGEFKELLEVIGQIISMAQQEVPNWKNVKLITEKLTDDSIIGGRWTAIGELDLKEQLGSKFDTYISLVSDLQTLIEKQIRSGPTIIDKKREKAITNTPKLNKLREELKIINDKIDAFEEQTKSVSTLNEQMAEKMNKVLDNNDIRIFVSIKNLTDAINKSTHEINDQYFDFAQKQINLAHAQLQSMNNQIFIGQDIEKQEPYKDPF